MKIGFTIAALAVLFLCAPAGAHDLWLEPVDPAEGGGYTLLSGHRHSDHEGQEVLAYDPAIVRFARCFEVDGSAVEAEVTTTYPVRMSCRGASVFVLVSSGYWTKTPYGTENVPRGDTEMVVRSWLSYESVKRIDQWSGSFTEPLTDELELVPLEDPLGLEPGDKLRLRVARGGAPVSGAVVSYDDRIRGETGKDGLINVKIRHGGLQRVQASLIEPLDSPHADETVTTTTLLFELPQ